MILKKNICRIIVVILILIISMSNTVSYATAVSDVKYGVLIGDNDNNYTLYDDLIVLSPDNYLMVKAYLVCEKLGLTYSYDKNSKKLTIKNTEQGKSLVLLRDSKNYTYYSSKSAKGIKRTSNYQCYYDEASKSNLIHIAVLKYLVGTKYKKLSDTDYYFGEGYYGIVYYNEYDSDVKAIPMPVTELTNEIVGRLQSYEKRGIVLADFNEINKYADESMHQEVVDIFFSKIIELEENEKFITSSNLTYRSSVADYYIRGILQTVNHDGTVYEQDYEFSFFCSVSWEDFTVKPATWKCTYYARLNKRKDFLYWCNPALKK